ncbi:hypothetical protein Tco_0453265 [Tanacetum coccineum]
MIAPGSSRYSSNDMVHNHYLEEAKKKTQESGRNSRPSVMPSARSQSTANGSKPKPRINNQKSRNWPASKTIGLRWVPTRKIFTSSTTKVDSEPTNADITNQYECEQTLDVSASTLNLSAAQKGSVDPRSSRKSLPSKESFVWIKASSKSLQGRVRGVICKLCAIAVDEDTTSRLWLQLQQNTVVLRLSVSHSNHMQPRAAFKDKAHPYSVSLHKGTKLKNVYKLH